MTALSMDEGEDDRDGLGESGLVESDLGNDEVKAEDFGDDSDMVFFDGGALFETALTVGPLLLVAGHMGR